MRHQAANSLVYIGDVGKVLSLVFCSSGIFVLRHEIGRRRHGFMRFMEGEIDKKWVGFLCGAIQPADDFIHGNLTTVAFQLADRFSVSNVICWVLVRWAGVVLCSKPMVETCVARLRLFPSVKPTVAVPFSRHASVVSCLLQQLRNRDFIFPHVNLFASVGSRSVARRDPVVDASSVRTSTG